MRKRIYFLSGFIILFIAAIAFLNFQMDDERYYGLYDYVSVPENADFSGGVVNINETTGCNKGDVVAEIPAMHVDAGTFIIDVDHQNDHDAEGIIYDGDEEIDRFVLPASELNTRYEFSSKDNLYNLRINYVYNGLGRVTIKRTILYSNGLFYYDTVLYAILLTAIVVFLAFLAVKYEFFSRPARDKIFYGSIVLFILFINYIYYRPYWVDATDIGFHLSRIEATYNEIKGGQIPVVMYSDALRGRGMIGVLYPYLFLIFPAFLRMIHISPDGAIRCFLILVNTCTCGTSYYAAKKLTKNREASLFFMMTYCLLGFRLTTMTYRYAIGEMQAFVFFPLIIAGLYQISVGDKKDWPILTIGLTGIINSHIISTIQAAIICIVVGVVFFVKIIRERRIIQVICAVVTTALLNMWYIVPFLTYYMSDIDVKGHLGNIGLSYITYYVSDMLQFFPNTNPFSQLHHQMGIVGIWLIAMVIIAAYYLMSDRTSVDSRQFFSITLILTGLLFLAMATKDFPWETLEKYEKIKELAENIQFASRLYLGGESCILFGCIIALTRDGKVFLKCHRQVFIALLIIALAQGYMITDSFISRIEPFSDVSETRFTPNVADRCSDDYVPEGYWDDNFSLITAESPSADITNYKHEHLFTSFDYTATEDTYVDLPLVYYIGYRAIADNGDSLAIVKGDDANIRIAVSTTPETRHISLSFVGFKAWRIAYAVSLISLIVTLVLFVRRGIMTREIK